MTSRLTTFRYQGVEYTVFSEESAGLDVSALTDAEREVMDLVIQGLSNAEVARRRKTAVRTVANQLQSMFRKLGVSSRAQLIARVPR